jgi:LacI family transcriptional regulator, galactose operon repressor
MNRNITLFDIADALGISTGTVHRALHDHRGVSSTTKAKVLQMAKNLGYRPNLAARYLSSKRSLRISVNTLKGTTSFWDDVRAGIVSEANSQPIENVDIQFRTYPQLGEGEQQAFEEALEARVDGMIIFPGDPEKLHGLLRKASQLQIPVLCVATDAPNTSRIAVVSIDTFASGALAADLMGRFLRSTGKLAVTVSDLAITEHAEKYSAFEITLDSWYPKIALLDPIEDHDIESETYEKCRGLFAAHPDLTGMYITTEASMPVLQAARDAGILENLTILTTDLFPALADEIRSGAVTATIYQRPRTQGRMAFRLLHEYIVEGKCSSRQLTFVPHLVMRGNLDLFQERHSSDSALEQDVRFQVPLPKSAGGVG